MNTKIQQRRVYYIFSPWLRIFHWIMVDSIIVLFVTGILICKPLEIAKVVRSFDPCMACATHIYNPEGEKLRVVTTDPYTGTRVES